MKAEGIGDTIYVGPEAEFFVFDDVKYKADPYNTGLTKLGLSLDATPSLARWYMAIGARPAVLRGLVVPRLPAHH